MARDGGAMKENHLCLPFNQVENVLGCQRAQGNLQKLLLSMSRDVVETHSGQGTTTRCIPPGEACQLIRSADLGKSIPLGLAIPRSIQGGALYEQNKDRLVTPLVRSAANSHLKKYLFSPYALLLPPEIALELWLERADRLCMNQKIDRDDQQLFEKYLIFHGLPETNKTIGPYSSFLGKSIQFKCRDDVEDFLKLDRNSLRPPDNLTRQERRRYNREGLKERFAEISIAKEYEQSDINIGGQNKGGTVINFDPNRDQDFMTKTKEEERQKRIWHQKDSLLEKINLLESLNLELVEKLGVLPFDQLPVGMRRRYVQMYVAIYDLLVEREKHLFFNSKPTKPNIRRVVLLATLSSQPSINQTHFVERHVPDLVSWGMSVDAEFAEGVRYFVSEKTALEELVGDSAHMEQIVGLYGPLNKLFLIVNSDHLKLENSLS